MLAIIEILFPEDSSKNQRHVTSGRFSTLQAYLVTTEKDCKHTWSVSDLRLQAYSVPFEIMIASILGPHFYQHCRHI